MSAAEVTQLDENGTPGPGDRPATPEPEVADENANVNPPDPPAAYVCTHFGGLLPAPTGQVATFMNTHPPAELRAQVVDQL